MSFLSFEVLRGKYAPIEIFTHIKNGMQPYSRRYRKPLPCPPEYHAMQIVIDFLAGKRALPQGWPVYKHPDPDEIEETYPVKEIKELEAELRKLDPRSNDKRIKEQRRQSTPTHRGKGPNRQRFECASKFPTYGDKIGTGLRF